MQLHKIPLYRLECASIKTHRQFHITGVNPERQMKEEFETHLETLDENQQSLATFTGVAIPNGNYVKSDDIWYML